MHGAYWKKLFTDQPNLPFIVRKVMEKGFKTKTGFISICGLHCLPIWLYMLKKMNQVLLNTYIALFLSSIPLVIFIFGRFLCLYCEVSIFLNFKLQVACF